MVFGAAVKEIVKSREDFVDTSKKGYEAYADEDWARWSQYCEGMGLSFYPWSPSESFEEWKQVQLNGGKHKWSWD